MKRFCIQLLMAAFAAFSLPAVGSVTSVVTPGTWDLYQGTAIVLPRVAYDSVAACDAAAQTIATTAKYTCRTSATIEVTRVGRDYFLADCKPGAEAGCEPGSATNDGLTPATPKQLWSQLPPRKGGDRILFAKGGSWVDATMGIAILTASAETPVVWDSYTPPWGGTAKPILTEARAGKYLFNFNDGGQKWPDGGYVIRNLDLRGGGVMGVSTGANAAVFLYWQVNDVTIDNVEISGFKNAVYSAHNPHVANGWENHRITLRNSYVHDNSASSFLGGAADLVIENNRLDRNGATPILDHDLYVSSATRARITGNTITRSVLNSQGKCSGSVIVVHGHVDGMLIERNKIIQPGGAPQCFGIEISGGYGDTWGSESFHDVVIRENRIVDVGYLGVGLRGCTRCVVERNDLIWTQPGAFEAISMSVNRPSSLDELGTALTIIDNNIWSVSLGSGVKLLAEGTGHRVVGNRITARKMTSCVESSAYAPDQVTVAPNECTVDAAAAVPAIPE
jgi:hypothetical protein